MACKYTKFCALYYITTLFFSVLSVVLALLQTIGTFLSYRATQSTSSAPQPSKKRNSVTTFGDVFLVGVLLIFILGAFLFPYQTPISLTTPPPLGDKAKADMLYQTSILARKADWTNTFTDPARSRITNGWTFYSQPQLGCQLLDGGLVARAEKLGAIADCYATNMNESDFAYQISIPLQTGFLEKGIIFRAAGPNSSGELYRFGVNLNRQTFQFLVQVSTTHQFNPVCNRAQLTECYNPAIRIHDRNSLTVIAQHSDFYFYINDTFVGQFTDTTRSRGIIGVFSYDRFSPSTARFENAQLWVL